MIRQLLVGCLVCYLSLSGLACSPSDSDTVSVEEIDELLVDLKLKLNDPDPRARALAARILGGHREKAQDVIPKLRELTKDKAREVREAASAALARLEGTAKPEK